MYALVAVYAPEVRSQNPGGIEAILLANFPCQLLQIVVVLRPEHKNSFALSACGFWAVYVSGASKFSVFPEFLQVFRVQLLRRSQQRVHILALLVYRFDSWEEV